MIGDPKQASTKFPHMHRVFTLLKRVLAGTYQGSVSSKYLSAYCNEFAFRFNRIISGARNLLCQRVLENALMRKPRVNRFADKEAIWPLAP